MEIKEDIRSLRERVGMTVVPTDPASLVTTLREIEDAGVDHIWVGFGPLWSSDLLTTLAVAATRTTRLKLGTSIVQVSSRHPVLMAQQALSLNQLAPGRLRLGLGTGSPAMAKSIYGIEMDAPLAYLREYIQVLRPLLQQGEAHHQGRYFTVDVSLPAASQVPLLMATLGPRSFRLAGEIADGALAVMCPPSYLLHTALPALQAGSTAARRDRPPLVAYVPIAFTSDRSTALEIGRREMSIYHTRSVYRNMFVAAGFSQQEIDTVSDSFIESLLVFGDEPTIKARIQELLTTGIDELTLNLLPVADAIQERNRLARLIGQL